MIEITTGERKENVAVYKTLEPEKLVTIAGWGGREEAWDAIAACRGG
ncbi:MAG: hypothetical protein WEB04_09895 [Dehalococcoidia bacterium]